MSLRKEQVLALLALAFCGWWYSRMEPAVLSRRFNPKVEEHEVAPVAKAPLVEADAASAGRDDVFTEPRETQPLPPRELSFPPRPPGACRRSR